MILRSVTTLTQLHTLLTTHIQLHVCYSSPNPPISSIFMAITVVLVLTDNKTQVTGRALQQRPKDDAPQTRRDFDYFVFPEASSSTGSETSVSCSEEDSGIIVPSAAFESAPVVTDIEAPAGASNNGVGDQGTLPRGETPATTASSAPENCNEISSARGDGGPTPPPCETKEDESCVERRRDEQAATTTGTITGPFAWAPSATPTECLVCLDSYMAGDRVCRIPCAHIFHAEVRQPGDMVVGGCHDGTGNEDMVVGGCHEGIRGCCILLPRAGLSATSPWVASHFFPL